MEILLLLAVWLNDNRFVNCFSAVVLQVIPYRNCGAQNCSDSLLQVFAARQFLRQSSVSDELRQAPRSLLSDGYCVHATLSE